MDHESPNLGTLLRKGLYAAQLKTYLRLFGRHRMLVMDSKTFARDVSESQSIDRSINQLVS